MPGHRRIGRHDAIGPPITRSLFAISERLTGRGHDPWVDTDKEGGFGRKVVPLSTRFFFGWCVFSVLRTVHFPSSGRDRPTRWLPSLLLSLRGNGRGIKSLPDRLQRPGNALVERTGQGGPGRGAVAAPPERRGEPGTVEPVPRPERDLDPAPRLLDEQHPHLDPAEADREVDQVLGVLGDRPGPRQVVPGDRGVGDPARPARS